MLSNIRKTAIAAGVIGAFGLGGAAIAGAAGNSATATPPAGARGHHGGGGRGDHKPETALTGDTKSKVEAAVLAKYPGATIERTETNTDGSAPYESHIKTSDGKELEVHVSKDFQVVS